MASLLIHVRDIQGRGNGTHPPVPLLRDSIGASHMRSTGFECLAAPSEPGGPYTFTRTHKCTTCYSNILRMSCQRFLRIPCNHLFALENDGKTPGYVTSLRAMGREACQWDRTALTVGLPVKIPPYPSLLKTVLRKDCSGLFACLGGGRRIIQLPISSSCASHASCTELLAPDPYLRVAIVSTTQWANATKDHHHISAIRPAKVETSFP